MSYHIVIPARMASERLPGKPLARIGTSTLVERVWLRAKASAASSVVIATDSEEVLAVAKAFGADALLTSKKHPSGSDRIAECADLKGWSDAELIVNLQGDEPLMPAACLDQVAGLLATHPDAAVASLYDRFADEAEAGDPNAVKVVTDRDGRALYFSRSRIPYARGAAGAVTWRRHIGLYAYRAGALRAFTRTPPTPLEQAEKLEQLRFLESGRTIVMAQASEAIPAGVDTPEDLARIRRLLAAAD
ncbi:MAG: 3-deoxy-manno-octulosonate cytidylyltransferase [Xanthomonadales bacterium]